MSARDDVSTDLEGAEVLGGEDADHDWPEYVPEDNSWKAAPPANGGPDERNDAGRTPTPCACGCGTLAGPMQGRYTFARWPAKGWVHWSHRDRRCPT